MVPRPDQDATARERTHRVRPQLDAATILEAALRLSVAGNSEALTVRSLGKEFGADPTAIYRHFRDKDELVLLCSTDSSAAVSRPSIPTPAGESG